MISEVSDAFKEAGVSDDKARKAAESIASYEDRFAKMDARIDREFAEVRSTLRLHSWILTTNTALLVALLFKIFSL